MQTIAVHSYFDDVKCFFRKYLTSACDHNAALHPMFYPRALQWFCLFMFIEYIMVTALQITLKDYHFSHQFKRACEKDVRKLCKTGTEK
jgi:hypothetical protein